MIPAGLNRKGGLTSVLSATGIPSLSELAVAGIRRSLSWESQPYDMVQSLFLFAGTIPRPNVEPGFYPRLWY